MTDVEAQEQNNLSSTGEEASPGKSKTEAGTKKKSPRSKSTHPPTSEMVNAAIKSLKERGGSSVQAIKKYMGANYKVDAEKMAPFIKKYLKSSVVSGAIIQTKGKGASGSFKLATAPSKKPDKAAQKPKGKATAVIKTSKARAATKAATTSPVKTKKAAATAKSSSPSKKRAATKAKKPAEKKESTNTVAATTTTKAAKAKSPSKAKKTTKSPTKKPKAPKPKTAKKAAKSPAKKKASPKKK